MNSRFPFFSRQPAAVAAPSLTDQLRTILIENGRKSVLFAADDPDLLTLVDVLEQVFQADIVAVNSYADLKLILTKRKFDIVFLDYKLSNGDSADIYREQLSKCPGTQVVFLTGQSLDEVSSKIHSAGPALMFPKPAAFTLPFQVHLLAQMGVSVRRPLRSVSFPDDPAVAAVAH